MNANEAEWPDTFMVQTCKQHAQWIHTAAIVFPLTHNMAYVFVHHPPPRYKLWTVKLHSKILPADLCVIVPVSYMCQVRLFIFSHNKYFQFQSFIRWHFRCNQLTFNSHYYTWAANAVEQRKMKKMEPCRMKKTKYKLIFRLCKWRMKKKQTRWLLFLFSSSPTEKWQLFHDRELLLEFNHSHRHTHSIERNECNSFVAGRITPAFT